MYFGAHLLEFVFESLFTPIEKNYRVRHFAQPVEQAGADDVPNRKLNAQGMSRRGFVMDYVVFLAILNRSNGYSLRGRDTFAQQVLLRPTLSARPNPTNSR